MTKLDTQATLNHIIRKQTMTPEEQSFMLKLLSDNAYKDHYHLTTEIHNDIIGKYRILTIHPQSADKEIVKLYMISKRGSDLVPFKIQYYELLRSEKKNSVKALRLSLLAKNIELTFAKELKFAKHSERAHEIEELLQKVKKASSYYSYKTVLDGRIAKDANGVQEINTNIKQTSE